MRFEGNVYVDDCIVASKGVYGIADKFSVIDKGDKVHVSLQTAVSGYGFVQPTIKKNWDLVSFGSSDVESVLKGRYPIYSRLTDIFAIVTVDGDYIKGKDTWSDNTRVEFYVPGGLLYGFDVNSPTKGVLSFCREVMLESTLCSCFLVGKERLEFNRGVTLRDAVLMAVAPNLNSKLDFYRARVY